MPGPSGSVPEHPLWGMRVATCAFCDQQLVLLGDTSALAAHFMACGPRFRVATLRRILLGLVPLGDVGAELGRQEPLFPPPED